jgi:regulator of replication initiation timing
MAGIELVFEQLLDVIAALSRTAEAAEERGAEHRADNVALNRAESYLKVENELLKAANGTLKAANGTLKAENGTLKAENERLRTELSASKAEKSALVLEAEALTANLAKMRSNALELTEAAGLMTEQLQQKNRCAPVLAAAPASKAEKNAWVSQAEALTAKLAKMRSNSLELLEAELAEAAVLMAEQLQQGNGCAPTGAAPPRSGQAKAEFVPAAACRGAPARDEVDPVVALFLAGGAVEPGAGCGVASASASAAEAGAAKRRAIPVRFAPPGRVPQPPTSATQPSGAARTPALPGALEQLLIDLTVQEIMNFH